MFAASAASLGAAAMLSPRDALAQKGRTLNVIIQGFSLAIHMPQVIALKEGLYGYLVERDEVRR